MVNEDFYNGSLPQRPTYGQYYCCGNNSSEQLSKNIIMDLIMPKREEKS